MRLFAVGLGWVAVLGLGVVEGQAHARPPGVTALMRQRTRVPDAPSRAASSPAASPAALKLQGEPPLADASASVDEPPPSDARLATGMHLGVYTGVVSRTLDFSQDVYGRMRSLNSNAYVARADLALFPSFEFAPAAGRVGIVAGYEGTLSGTVRDTDFDLDYSAEHSEFYAGLRSRHPLGDETLLGLELTLGRLSSGLDDSGDTSGVPGVRYTLLRAALDLGFPLGDATGRVVGGFRLPLGYGEIGSSEWFPRAGGYGVDARLEVSYPLLSQLDVDVAGTLRRFILEMNPEPGDARDGISETVGGATDSYLAAYVGFTYTP